MASIARARMWRLRRAGREFCGGKGSGRCAKEGRAGSGGRLALDGGKDRGDYYLYTSLAVTSVVVWTLCSKIE
jgi:hypothetical protein